MPKHKATRACENVSQLFRFTDGRNTGSSIVYIDDLLPGYIEIPTEASDREVFFQVLRELSVVYNNRVGGDLFRDFAALADR